MQFVNLDHAGRAMAAVAHPHGYVLLPGPENGDSPELGERIRREEDLPALGAQALAAGTPLVAGSAAALAPLLTRPGKIICLGLNYYDHAKEGGRDKPTYPWFFLRAPSSLVAHGQAAWLPRVSGHFDYEAELAVVIGKRARHVMPEQALDMVLGYACFNDMSVRDYQKKTPQWTVGKNFDRTGGFGPALVLAGDLPPGGRGLGIACRVNGQTVQEANTDDMIFDVAEAIGIVTECMTLEPGDVLVMGTPAGVGMARTPPLWLKPQDTVEVEIERVGRLCNPVLAEP